MKTSEALDELEQVLTVAYDFASGEDRPNVFVDIEHAFKVIKQLRERMTVGSDKNPEGVVRLEDYEKQDSLRVVRGLVFDDRELLRILLEEMEVAASMFQRVFPGQMCLRYESIRYALEDIETEL